MNGIKKRKPATLKEKENIEISNMFERLSSEDEIEAKENSKPLKKRKSKCDDEVSLAEKDGRTDLKENERGRKKALQENHYEEEKDRIKESKLQGQLSLKRKGL